MTSISFYESQQAKTHWYFEKIDIASLFELKNGQQKIYIEERQQQNTIIKI